MADSWEDEASTSEPSSSEQEEQEEQAEELDPTAAQAAGRHTGTGTAAAEQPGAAGVDLTGDGGVRKLILRAAPADAPAPSKENYVCVVHYVGTLHDGTEFDSSRVDDRPFTVELGKNRVIKAWEVAVPTMRVGELCRVVCSSDYGYGDAGDPPEIPPRATLTFEMELMGVRCMLRDMSATADTTARDTARRLEQLKLEREREVAQAAEARGDAAQRKAAAKAAAAERLANKGQKKGGKKKK